MRPRAAVIAGVVALAAVLFALDDPHGTSPDVVVVDTNPVAAEPGDGSTWFCAGGPVGTDVSHRVILSSVQDEPVIARVSGFDAEGTALEPLAIEVASNATATIESAEIGAGVNGVMVEFIAGAGIVAQEQSSATGIAQAPCDTAAAPHWYFAAASTEIDSIAVVWLLNPFPADASVDVGASTDDGFRVAGDLSGIVVPARSSRAVSLGESIERREQFSVQIDTREGSGPVIAALTQVVTGAARPDGSPERRGLDLIRGQSVPATSWLFADGVAGSGYRDEVIVFNPADDAVTVELAVMPAGVEAELLPDPFIVEIAARRFASVVVSDETRVPADGVRWMSVRSDGDGVVAARVSTVVENGGDGTVATRPGISRGMSTSSGSAAMATTWWFAGVGSTGRDGAVVTVANPSSESIALIDVYVGGEGNEVPVAESVEIAPLSSLAIDVSEWIQPATTLRVSSESAVVAEMRTIDDQVSDQAIVEGTPASEGREPLQLGRSGG